LALELGLELDLELLHRKILLYALGLWRPTFQD